MKTRNSQLPTPIKRIFNEGRIVPTDTFETSGSPFRLLPYDDSSVAIISTSGVFTYQNNTFSRTDITPSSIKVANLNYIYNDETTRLMLDVENQDLFFENKKAKEHISVKPLGNFTNGVWFHGNFIADVFDKSGVNIDIAAWNPTNNKWQTIYALSEKLRAMVAKSDSVCFLNALEGNFFAIDRENFGYYFYQSGYFLLFGEEFKNPRFIKSIAGYEFMKFNEKPITGSILNGEFFGCFPERETIYQLSATGNSQFVALLSNAVNRNEPRRCVDFYDLATAKYRFSIAVNKLGENMPIEILIRNNIFWILFENGAVTKSKFYE